MSDVLVYCTEFDRMVDPYAGHHCQEGAHMETVADDSEDEDE